MIIEVISAVIVIIALTGTGAYWYITRDKGKKIKLMPNAPLIEIDSKQIQSFTSGHCRGVLIKDQLNRNNTHHVWFYPTDTVQGENIDRPNIQDFIISDSHYKPQGRGRISPHREIIKVVAKSPKDIPSNIRGTENAKFDTMEIQEAFLEQTFGNMFTAGEQALKKKAVELLSGSISMEGLALKREKDLAQASSQLTNSEKEKV